MLQVAKTTFARVMNAIYAHYSFTRYWAYLFIVSALSYFSHPLEQFFSFVTLNLILGLFNLTQMNNYQLGFPMYIGPPERPLPNKPAFQPLRQTWYAGYTVFFWFGIVIQLSVILVHSLR